MKRIFSLLPVFGIGSFLILYFYAAELYPGGTRIDPASIGFSHLKNFWCDLLDSTSYSGSANPGRPYALIATILLPLSLISWHFM